ncbi:unnamed protein product [Rotaria magnacalcarata]
MEMNCSNTNIWTQDIMDGNDTQLLQDEQENTIIIDFGSLSNLKNQHNIIVRMSNMLTKNIPVDTSFVSFLHPTLIADRSNVTDRKEKKGSEFTDVKIFIDSLLIGYQTNKTIEFEIERSPMTCTPIRRDSIFIKEMLKILDIKPILNNFAHAIRTFIILVILILFLCFTYKLKLKPDAYFNSVRFSILFFDYLIFVLQLISCCIMNAQLFDKNVRAIMYTFIIYLASLIIFTNSVVWPVAIQYILIFLSPYIAGHSLFQQAILHDLARKDVALFRTSYSNVPMYFPTLIIMILSCVFYWLLSWYLEKVFPGEYGIPLEWNFLFKRQYWHPENVNYHTHSYNSRNSSPQLNANSNGKSIVRVNHLVKTFDPDKIAVNDVSLDLFENQIT